MRQINERVLTQRWLAWAWLCAICLLAGCAAPQPRTDADLPSWSDGPSRAAIVDFVNAVTQPGSPDFVPPDERIAVFDNDGTLWSEQPMYFEVLFAMDEVRAQAPLHPEWKTTQPFKAVLDDDKAALARSGEEGLKTLVAATHTDMTVEQFSERVSHWMQDARHPTTGMAYSSMTFQPMRELLVYLRARGFKTYIVSGGETEFMRPWTQAAYGIPPEQVIGTSFVSELQTDGGVLQIMRLRKLDFLDDGPGKPVAIQRYIGRRPILAFGNSDGDLQMLQWTTAGPGRRFGGLVHHTDAKREWAYDRESSFGRLDKALDAARAHGWTVVDMENEWKRIYQSEKP